MEATVPVKKLKVLRGMFACASKFGDHAFLEAQAGALSITTLSSARNAFATFKLSKHFFQSYSLLTSKNTPLAKLGYEPSLPPTANGKPTPTPGKPLSNFHPSRMTGSAAPGRGGANGSGVPSGGSQMSLDSTPVCKVNLKTTISIFRTAGAAANERHVEKAVLRLDPAADAMTFVLHCKQGIQKAYTVPYEDGEPLRAVFSKAGALVKFTAEPKLISGALSTFGGNTPEVLFHALQDKLAIKSCPKRRKPVKDMNPLDRTLLTQASIKASDFNNTYTCANGSWVTDQGEPIALHFTLKELKAVLAFVEATQQPLQAFMEAPGRPIIFSTRIVGDFDADFVIATISLNEDQEGEPRAAPDGPPIHAVKGFQGSGGPHSASFSASGAPPHIGRTGHLPPVVTPQAGMDKAIPASPPGQPVAGSPVAPSSQDVHDPPLLTGAAQVDRVPASPQESQLPPTPGSKRTASQAALDDRTTTNTRTTDVEQQQQPHSPPAAVDSVVAAGAPQDDPAAHETDDDGDFVAGTPPEQQVSAETAAANLASAAKRARFIPPPQRTQPPDQMDPDDSVASSQPNASALAAFERPTASHGSPLAGESPESAAAIPPTPPRSAPLPIDSETAGGSETQE